MASKYAKVLANLERLAGEDTEYQNKVSAVRQEITEEPDFQMHASSLAARYLKVRAEKEKLEAEMYDVNLELTAVEQLLIDQYEVEGTTKVTLETGESIAVQPEPYAQVQNKDEFRQWCLEQGLGNLMSIPWATTNMMTKQRLLEGQPEPPGVKAFIKSKIVRRG